MREVFLIGLAVTAAVMSGAAAEPSQAARASSVFDESVASKALETLATLLEDNFIYPDVGKAYASMLRDKVAKRAYSKLESAESFAATVTKDLQAVSPEGHLRLQAPDGGPRPGPLAASSEVRGVGKSGWLAPGVGYMSLHGFTGPGPQLTKLEATLDALSSATTLIIDARPYLGGWVRETDVMFSYFFSEPTTMVAMETRLAVEQRGGSPLADGPTVKRIAGPEGVSRRVQIAVPIEKETGLRRAKIFVLTSKNTISGGEHFCLAMKRTKRATLIGETTAGAGHFGGMRALGGGYGAFVPVGRTFDPDTNQGWEGTGVTPDVSVSANDALDEALRRAGVDLVAAKKALDALK